jgi:hypothetical protein
MYRNHIKKIHKYLMIGKAPYIIPVLFFLSGCTHLPERLGEPQKLYDFEHKVHYTKVKINNEHFTLQIKSTEYAFFEKHSGFLLRQSKRLCLDKYPQITIKQGIIKYQALPTKPEPYKPDLFAIIKCINL